MESASGVNVKLLRALQVAETGWRESLQLAKERQCSIELKDLEIEALKHNVAMCERQLFLHIDKDKGLNVALCNSIEDIHLSTAELAMELRKCILSGDITDKATAIAERIRKKDIEPTISSSDNGLDRLSGVNDRLNSLLYWISEKVITDKHYNSSSGAELLIPSFVDDESDLQSKVGSTKSSIKAKKVSTANTAQLASSPTVIPSTTQAPKTAGTTKIKTTKR